MAILPFVHLTRHSSTASEQIELYFSGAGNRHHRFDERGWVTERYRMAQATSPILDSRGLVLGRRSRSQRREAKRGVFKRV